VSKRKLIASIGGRDLHVDSDMDAEENQQESPCSVKAPGEEIITDLERVSVDRWWTRLCG